MGRRKSTAGNSVETGSFEVTNTGLRPSWTEFWEMESADWTESGQYEPARTRSTTGSTTRTESVYRQVRFITGSEWYGEWDRLGMNGFGTYRMPHGVVYEGMMNNGLFEGIGILRYPNGGAVEGLWHDGRLKYCQYEYADGLRRDQTMAWPYCKTPDRRFYSEILRGLKAADTEQLANAEPPFELPPGSYDEGDGVYSPQTKCSTNPTSGAIMRIPTVAEERWILDNCRSASEDSVGYRPELYPNWWQEDPPSVADLKYMDEDDAILQLVLQAGCDLDPVGPGFSTTDTTCNTPAFSTSHSHSNEFEDFVRRVVKEVGEAKRKSLMTSFPDLETPTKTEDVTEPGEWFEPEEEEEEEQYLRTSSLVKVIQEISQKYLARGKTDRPTESKTVTINSTTTVEMMKLGSLEMPLEMMRASKSSKPFHVLENPLSLTLSPGPTSTMKKNIVDEYEEYGRTHQHQDFGSSGSELMQSKLKYEIDYVDFESDDSGNP